MQQTIDYASLFAADERQYAPRYFVLIWSLRLLGLALVLMDVLWIWGTLYVTYAYFPFLTCSGLIGLATFTVGLQKLKRRGPIPLKWLNFGLCFLWGRFWYNFIEFEYHMQFDWHLVEQWYHDHLDPFFAQTGTYVSNNSVDFQFVAISLLILVSILTLCLNIREWVTILWAQKPGRGRFS